MTYDDHGVANGSRSVANARSAGDGGWHCASRSMWRVVGLAAVLIVGLSLGACDSAETASQEQEAQDPAQPGSAVPPAAPTTAPTQPQTAPVGSQQPIGQPGTAQTQQPPPAATASGGVDSQGKRRRVMPVDLVRFVPEGVCTKRACPPEKPCCNTCRFKRWRPQVGEFMVLKGSTTETRNIPSCKMNGCGRCAFHLLANGMIDGNRFKAFDIRKVKPSSGKKKETASVR